MLVGNAVLNAAYVRELRSEYRTNPQGMDSQFPRLSWVIESIQRGEKQTAYQVLVASTPELLAEGKGDLWDSGKVASDRQNQLEYAGKSLKSRMSCYWKVRIWDKGGKASAWSRPAWWTMGLLQPGDWKAKWIGVNQKAAAGALTPSNSESTTDWAKPRYLRKSFTLDRTVRRATVYATALGLYELRLNGQRVGDHLLAPEWTDYHKHVQYQTYDVTSLMRNGPNALAAILGNGWYSGGWQHWDPKLEVNYGTEPFLLAQLEIEFTDRSRQMIVSDDNWRGTTDGPLQFAGIYEGVTYDARLEMPGWDAPGFNDAKWSAVTTHQAGDDFKVGRLVWQRNEPIRAAQELKPVAITAPHPGVYVFAFAQNMVGWCRFKARGKVGETVELQHGEMRNPDGTVFTGNLCVVSKHRAQLDRYTFRLNGMETFEPRFTYHGFQYVEVRGLKEKPALDSLTGVVFHSACPEVGQFASSDPLLNRLALNILWSQRGNYMGIPTDCPQRNERCGYTGDAQFFIRAAVYNMDIAAFFNKWLVDVCEDSQLPGGWFADHAPFFCPKGGGPNIGWTDGGIICPYEIYRTYGDTRVIRDHYAAMKRNLDWLAEESTDFLYTGRVGNGDWLSTGGGVGKEVIGTAYSAFDFHLMAEMADAIGKKGDAMEFRDRADKIATAFANAYLDTEGHIKNSSQSGYALAFTMGLVPAPLREKMIDRFVDEVRRFDWHPRTGFIGTPRLLPGLHLAGRDDDAYKLLLTKTAPSWLFPVTIGATTIWEQWVAWDGKTPRGGMNSLNHYSFGSVGEYLYGMVGGIQPAASGYKQIHIQPVIREGLTWAKTSYDSICGKIATAWKVEADKLELDVIIPANTTATVYVPAKDAAAVTESGKPAAQAEGVKFLRMEDKAAVFEVGSGQYQFESNK
jgi:alpha-L-rhamnosidase